jgi:hypothetical protein
MKKILGLSTLALAGVLAFTGCSCKKDEEKTATAYAYVHGNYLGVATVSHKGNDVTEVSFDEVMLPYNWAGVAISGTAITEGGTANKTMYALGAKAGSLTTAAADADLTATTYASHGTTYATAKYITIGDYTFAAMATDYKTSRVRDASGATMTNYASGTFVEGTFKKDGKIANLYEYVATEAGAKWYYDAMTAGNYDVLKADGTSLGLTYADGKGTAALKSTNGYGSDTFNWGNNMNAIATYLVEKDNLDTINVFDYTKTHEVDGKNYFGTSDTDVVTGATLTDFADYVYLAKVAFNK